MKSWIIKDPPCGPWRHLWTVPYGKKRILLIIKNKSCPYFENMMMLAVPTLFWSTFFGRYVCIFRIPPSWQCNVDKLCCVAAFRTYLFLEGEGGREQHSDPLEKVYKTFFGMLSGLCILLMLAFSPACALPPFGPERRRMGTRLHRHSSWIICNNNYLVLSSCCIILNLWKKN